MMIITHSVTRTASGYDHAIVFEFGNKKFEANVIETADETYVDQCFWLHIMGAIEIDIPAFFGTGFSSDIYQMIYEAIETDDEDESEGEDVDE